MDYGRALTRRLTREDGVQLLRGSDGGHCGANGVDQRVPRVFAIEMHSLLDRYRAERATGKKRDEGEEAGVVGCRDDTGGCRWVEQGLGDLESVRQTYVQFPDGILSSER